MDKKTKNIIAIVIIVILFVGIILTFHFGRVNGSKNYINDQRIQMFDNSQRDDNNKERPSFPSDNDISANNDSNQNDDSITERKDSRSNRPSGNVPSFNKDDMKDIGNVSMPNREGTFTTKYVVLLCVESLLLGGAIMYIINNNLGKETIKNVEKTTKKGKK